MRPPRAILYSLLIFILLSSVYFFYQHRSRSVVGSPPEYVQLLGGTTTITIEYARTPDEQLKGLSGRAALPEGNGMLFVFDSLDAHPFWMPDMKFAIDMIWIGKDKKIVYIKDNATPESYPAVFKSGTPALYVLEVPSGFAAKSGWIVGTPLVFTTSTSPHAQQ